MRRSLYRKSRRWPCFFFAMMWVGVLCAAEEFLLEESKPEEQPLSSLSLFNRSLLLIKEEYVDPSRFDPKGMLLSSLDYVQKIVPELIISRKTPNILTVQMGKKSKIFSLEAIDSLWDLSFCLRDIFKFMEPDISSKDLKKEIEYAAINGMLSRLDPHSIFFDPKFSEEIHSSTQGEFAGCGFSVATRDGYLTIISPMENSPAEKAGIKPQDRLVKIENDSTINMTSDEAVEKLRGPPNTPVHVTILRKGESVPRQITIIRDIIKVAEVNSHRLGDIAYVKAKFFSSTMAADAIKAIKKMRESSTVPLKGVILDLRNNPGGLYEQAIQLLDAFLRGGMVVATQGSTPENRSEEYASEEGDKIDLPVVVIINSGSASASEIVAGAFKNRDAGVVIGEQSFGKGSVQILYDFEDSGSKSSLKLTTGQYLTPGNESIQSVGITPDVYLHPVVVKDASLIDLFADAHMREENLDFHLNDEKRVRERKPLYRLDYLQSSEEPVDLETAAIDEIRGKFKNDFEIDFARRLLEQATGKTKDSLLKSAAVMLAQLQVTQKDKLLEALRQFNVDWTPPSEKSTKAEIGLALMKPAKAKAGESLEIQLLATNKGTEPVWQLYGTSDSPTPGFKDQEFIFGRIDPEKTAKWTAKIKIPKETLTRRDTMRIAIYGNEGQAMGRIDVPIEIQGLEHPVLAHTFYADDDREGNGDGLLKEGEKIDLITYVKNVGKGVAEEPIILLRSLNGSAIYLSEGRQKLKPLKPGAMGVGKFVFTVRKPVDVAKFELHIYDAVMGDFWMEKIEIPFGAKDIRWNPKNIPARITADKVPLRASVKPDAPIIAYLHKGDEVLQVRSGAAGISRIRVDEHLSGFVKDTVLSPLPGKDASQLKLAKAAELEWSHVPPRIQFISSVDSNMPLKEKYTLKYKVKSEGNKPVKDVILFLNEQKINYTVLEKSEKTERTFEMPLKLKPGVNVITLIARLDDSYAQRESITLYSSEGDPFKGQNISMAQR